jgi:hypothetical protein
MLHHRTTDPAVRAQHIADRQLMTARWSCYTLSQMSEANMQAWRTEEEATAEFVEQEAALGKK